VIGCAILFPRFTAAQTITKNAFAGATVTNGLITFYKGDPANKEQLSFIGTSYLTARVNGVYYSNDPHGGLIGPGNAATAVILTNDETTKIGDTISTLWKEGGFDIVQKVYSVAFSNSGVIVLGISIVNHTNTAMTAQAQYLLDNLNSNTTGGDDSLNDSPFIVENKDTVTNWLDCPPNPIPSYYLAFEFAPSSPNRGTVGIGYLNDSFTPLPIGLLPLSFIEFGNWTDQVYYSWGPPDTSNFQRKGFTDEATLMMGQPTQANGVLGDSVTEIMRTAYGTPPASLLNSSVSSRGGPTEINRLDVFPNPFAISTTLSYSLDSRCVVKISIYDALGREVRSLVSGGEEEAGEHEATLEFHYLAPGVYACRLIAGGEEQTVKVVVTR
jgi:hypothetical protein